jgi:hypothetical protein
VESGWSLGAGVRSELGLARLAVSRVPGAPTAVLAQLDPLPVVVPVLARDVVASSALRALERHVDAPITGHGLPLELEIAKVPVYERGMAAGRRSAGVLQRSARRGPLLARPRGL